MTGMTKRAGLLMAASVMAAACGTSSPASGAAVTAVQSATPTPQSVDLPSDSLELSSAASPTLCGHADMAVDRGPYVIAGIEVPGFFPNMGPKGWQKDDLALREVVILGRVVAKEPSAFGGQAHVYTPFAVEVERVIRGEASPGRTRVSIEGGTVGCYEVHVDTVPALQVGSQYVLFLIGPTGTDPPPGVWDAWMVDNQDVVWTYQGPMPLAQLIDRIHRLPVAAGSTIP
jgi:hypothetical protein